MAGSSKSAKAKKSSAPAGAPRSRLAWLKQRLFRPAPLIMLATVVSAAVLAPYVPWLLPDLSKQGEYQFPLAEAEVTPPAGWVPVSLPKEIAEAAELPEVVSLLDRDLCRRVGEAWQRNPWVREVHAVRITNRPGLSIEVTYRTPAALVEVPDGLYPIDGEGVLLPPVDFSMSDAARLPHIRGAATLPEGSAGRAWGDEVIHAAARLAVVLTPEQDLDLYWKRFRFAAIVVPSLPADVPASEAILEIETLDGSRIVWGKAPGADSLEPSVEQKLARLDYLDRFGTLKGLPQPQRIDIRLFDGISLQPLEERRWR